MTLTKNVKDAVSRVDRSLREWRICQSPWQTIRAHLMSQAAEIDRLSQESAQQFIRARDWAELSGKNEDRASLAESRLAAAKAEIEQLQAGLAKHVNRVCELQSRLAAANALLRECRRMAARLLPTPHDLYEQIDAFLQGAAHDRA